MMNVKLKKLTLCALLTAFAILSFTLENLFPPLVLPGARMGISNIFILLSAIYLGAPYGFATLIIKVTLGSLFAGNISAIMYSLPAGIISLSLELLLLTFIKKVSLVSVSIAGSVINVTIQNTVFCLVTGVTEYLGYLPYLALISVISGLIIGFTVYIVIKKVSVPFLRENIKN
jgi:heptaprenyl diphosphate synthase